MDITNEQALELLKLPKKILNRDKNKLLDNIIINQVFPFNIRYELVSEQNNEFTFLLEINQSKKNSIRINVHYQENESKIGLLRIDFNGGTHKNPEIIHDELPIKFHQYVGKFIEMKVNHIHYYVKGYKNLAWAIPLTDEDFEIKELKDDANFNNNLADIIQLFAKTVNIQTNIQINTLLL